MSNANFDWRTDEYTAAYAAFPKNAELTQAALDWQFEGHPWSGPTAEYFRQLFNEWANFSKEYLDK